MRDAQSKVPRRGLSVTWLEHFTVVAYCKHCEAPTAGRSIIMEKLAGKF